MLLMVVEQFTEGNTGLIRERFLSQGRMLPEDVEYLASWVEATGGRCFQLMEAPGPEALGPWMRCWEDLVEFEVVPVVSSAEFWAQGATLPE